MTNSSATFDEAAPALEDPAASALASLAASAKLPRRKVGPAVFRGFRNRCPSCGKGRLMRGYIKVVDECPVCGEDLSHQRADDAPPYLTMVITGHIIVPLMLLTWTLWPAPAWVYLSIFIPATLIMTLTLLRPIKGAVVGIQWANRMHGFGGEAKVGGVAS